MTSTQAKLVTTSLVVIALVAGTVALIYTRSVMLPFIFSALIAYTIAPVVGFLERRLKLKRWASLSLTSVLVFSGIFVVVSMITGTVRKALANLDAYQERVALLAQKVFAWTESMGFGNQAQLTLELQNGLDLPYLAIVRTTAGTLGDFLGNATLVVLFVLFLLSGTTLGLPKTGIWREVDQKIRSYLVTKTIASLATGFLTALLLGMIGVDMAMMFGVLAFFLNFIPTVGSIVAVLLPIPVAALQFDSVLPVALTIALPGAVQFFVGNVMEPKVMGDSLQLHPVTVMLALMFWGLVWGVPGMILATPLVVIAKICLLRIDGGRVYANLLAGELPT